MIRCELIVIGYEIWKRKQYQSCAQCLGFVANQLIIIRMPAKWLSRLTVNLSKTLRPSDATQNPILGHTRILHTRHMPQYSLFRGRLWLMSRSSSHYSSSSSSSCTGLLSTGVIRSARNRYILPMEHTRCLWMKTIVSKQLEVESVRVHNDFYVFQFQQYQTHVTLRCKLH